MLFKPQIKIVELINNKMKKITKINLLKKIQVYLKKSLLGQLIRRINNNIYKKIKINYPIKIVNFQK